MSTVLCRIFSIKDTNKHKSAKGAVSILEVYPNAGGKSYRLIITGRQDIQFKFGDGIKSISGTAFIMINPGTAAGAFFLAPQLPHNADPKYRTELEICDAITKNTNRGEIVFDKDSIGAITSATATTR